MSDEIEQPTDEPRGVDAPPPSVAAPVVAVIPTKAAKDAGAPDPEPKAGGEYAALAKVLLSNSAQVFRLILMIAIALVIASVMLVGTAAMFGYRFAFLVPRKPPTRQIVVPAVAGWVPVNPAGQPYRAGTVLTISPSGRVLTSIRSANNLARWRLETQRDAIAQYKFDEFFRQLDGGWQIAWTGPQGAVEYPEEQHPFSQCRMHPSSASGALVYGLSDKQPSSDTVGIHALTGEHVFVDDFKQGTSIHVDRDNTYLYLSINEAVLTQACAPELYAAAATFAEKCNCNARDYLLNSSVLEGLFFADNLGAYNVTVEEQ